MLGSYPAIHREVEKPKTVKGRNELLRQRARGHAMRLQRLAESLSLVGASRLANDVEVARNLLEELAEALKP